MYIYIYIYVYIYIYIYIYIERERERDREICIYYLGGECSVHKSRSSSMYMPTGLDEGRRKTRRFWPS